MSAQPAEAPPHVQLIQMATACFLSRLVYTAASLGIADHLSSGPKSADDLSEPTGCDARALYRFMRALTNFGILTLGDDGKFALTPLGAALKSDAPGFARSAILTMTGQWSWQAWQEFPYSVQTGKPALDKALGMSLFDHLAQHPDEAARFSETMVTGHGAEPPAIAEAYDFAPFGVVIDVGGATGNMLAHLLARYPQPKGILFDRDHVVKEASELLRNRGVENRVTIQPGSFFESVPSAGDAYILSHVIHDWSEAQCLTILGNCRKAMKPTSKLLLIELVLREGNAPGFGSSDMVMMAMTGGAERTAEEYRALLARAGLKMTRIIPTTTTASVIEAVLA
jgi:hypothetical protein